MKMNIPLLNLTGQYHELQAEIDDAIRDVLLQGTYILGSTVERFETDFKAYVHAKHAVGVASGSDALLLSLDALGIGPGDRVLVPTFTFFATAGAVSRLGAVPVFVDLDPTSYNFDLDSVETHLSKDPRIKAIIPVHLFGQPVDLERIADLAAKYQVKVVEDACQAIDAETSVRGEIKKVGTVGSAGCFSFFPSKNLGGYGDGGMIITQDDALAEKLRLLRVHGAQPKYHHQLIGYNSRLDVLQAAVLNVKLRHLPQWTAGRIKAAQNYASEFSRQNLAEKIVYPEVTPGHVFHQYVIQTEKRDQLAAYLRTKGIGPAVYYPAPLHLQKCFASLGYQAGDLPLAEKICPRVLALPIDPALTLAEIQYVVQCIREFFADS
jgi:dTDP-4-amino-4,6-dideoxygalactose transaminase